VGIVAGGTGLGIIATGYLLPFLLVSLGKEAWRGCWMVMAWITFSVAVAGSILLKDRPIGFHQGPEIPEEKKATPSLPQRDELTLRMIFLVYFVIGFAYIIYATYFVAYMVEDLKLSEKTAGDIWAIFGWMCMASGVLWGFLSDRLGRRKSLLWNIGSSPWLFSFLSIFIKPSSSPFPLSSSEGLSRNRRGGCCIDRRSGF